MPRGKSTTATKAQTAEVRKSSAEVEDDILDTDVDDADDSYVDWNDKGDNKVSRQLQARRRIEDLMEERLMRQLLGDDWNLDMG